MNINININNMNTDRDLVRKHLGLDVILPNLEDLFFDDDSINLQRCVTMTKKYPKLNDFLEEYLMTCDNINKVDMYGHSILHRVVCNLGINSTEKTGEILINAGINVNLQSKNGATALHYGVIILNKIKNNSLFKTVEMLIQAEADVFNLKFQNKAPIDYFSEELLEYYQIDKKAQTIGIKSGKFTKVAKK